MEMFRVHLKKGFLVEQDSEITNPSQLNPISGFDDVIEKILLKKQYSEEQINKIKDFIRKSGVGHLEISPILNASGMALDDKVIIDPKVFQYTIARLLYILFHEIAHAYQYKKYGKTKKWSMYFNEQSIEDSARFMKYLENIADDFALRKLREFVKSGLLTQDEIKNIYPVYSNISLNYFIKFIEFFRKIIEERGITEQQQINDLLYRYAKVGNMEILKQYTK
jgi:hypothetical protein